MLVTNCKVMDRCCKTITVSHHLLISVSARNNQCYRSIDSKIRRRADKPFLFLLSAVSVFISLALRVPLTSGCLPTIFLVLSYHLYCQWNTRCKRQCFGVVTRVLWCVSLGALPVTCHYSVALRWFQTFIQPISLYHCFTLPMQGATGTGFSMSMNRLQRRFLFL